MALAPILLWSTGAASADEGSIRVLSTSIATEFPEGFRVKAEVSGDNEITSIALRFRVGQRTRGAYEYMEFEVGQLVDSELFWRTNTSARYIPPGTIITYNLEIEDSEGGRFDTEEQEFIYHDARFDWEEVSQGVVSVAYHGPVKKRAEIILEAIIETLEFMGPLLGAGIDEPIRVTMYSNVKEMLEALPPGSTTIRRELITEGQAFTDVGTLLTLGSGRLAKGTASHEVIHILSHRAANSIFQRVPSWLGEGLSEYGNVDPGFSYDIALEFALETNRLLPITQMGLPGDPEQVIIFYGQASSIVRYMVARWGPGNMRDLLAKMKEGLDTDEALLEVYGLDSIGLENGWRELIGAPPYVPPRPGQTRPTPIPRPAILPYSLTPQPESSTVGSSTGDPTPSAAEAEADAPAADAEPGFVPKPVSESDPLKTDAEEAPTGVPEPAPAAEDTDTGGGGGACSAPSPGGTRAMDLSSVALLVGLAGLGVRRRLRR